MSTNAVIGIYVPGNDGRIHRDRRRRRVQAVYHHWDGYPTWLGCTLWSMVHGPKTPSLRGLLDRILEHKAGWSDLSSGSCYCHPTNGRAPEKGRWLGSRAICNVGARYGYLFDVENGTMDIVTFSGDCPVWEDVYVVSLDGEEPDWESIEERLLVVRERKSAGRMRCQRER